MEKEIDNLKKRKGELLESKEFMIQKKKELINTVQNILSKYNSKRISKIEYYEEVNKELSGKTSEKLEKEYDDYIAYYDYQIELCNKLIKQEKVGNRNQKIVFGLKLMIFVVLFMIIISFSFIISPKAINTLKLIGEKTSSILPSLGLLSTSKNLNESITIQVPESVKFSQSTLQYQAILNKTVKWKTEINLEETTDFSLELPENSENIKILKIENRLKEDITPDIKKTNRNVKINIQKSSLNFEIEYETPAPKVSEEIIENKKRIIIKTDAEYDYENILSFSDIPETLKLGQEARIKVSQIKLIGKSETKESINFKAYDTNENGLLDYVEWITPHLSEAVFEIEIINITKAEHLNKNKNFINDVYDSVKEKDNIWSEPIYNNEYIRITFEKELDNSRDITLYARNNQSLNTTLEVYYFNSSEKITEFPIITNENYYKVYLIGMQGSSDIFDLKIKNLDNPENDNAYLEFDYIVDPTGTPISTCSELQAVTGTNNYYLANDIDCSETRIWNSGAGFIPLNLIGNFDGNYHSIKNLYINQSTVGSGLFESISGPDFSTAVVKNLDIINISILNGTGCGGLAASATFVNISNVSITGNIRCDGVYSVGGLIGTATGFIIQDTYSSSNIKSNAVNLYSLGGLVGRINSVMDFDSIINSSYATGNFSASGNTYIGGLVGEVYQDPGSITIFDSFSSANISGNYYKGGIVGFADYDGVGISNVYWNNHSRNPLGNPPNCIGIGWDTGPGTCTQIPNNEAYFYDLANQPMTKWSRNIWKNSPGTFPVFNRIAEGPSALSCGIINIPGTYRMTKNLNESDVNSTGCFNITASNVELDCNGYFIRNTTLAKPGIYAGDNLVNITVKNCNVTMSTSSPGYGIQFNSVNNSFIINNTVNSDGYGIYLTSSSNNIITNNTANSNQHGIYLFSSSDNTIQNNIADLNSDYGILLSSSSNNNQVINNTANSNSIDGILLSSSSNNNQIINNTANSNLRGILLSSSSNNTLINNTANSNSWYGIFLTSSSNNQLINNTANSNAHGIYLDLSSNNTFTNNNIWNCTTKLGGCIHIASTSQNNIFTGGLINLSLGNLIYITSNSNNNLFQDLILLGATNNDTFLTSTSINNTFLNVSYNSSKESVASDSELIRQWYYRAYVNDTTGIAVSNANVTAYNRTNGIEFANLTTNSTGWTNIIAITDYINNGGVRNYYSNYTLYATNGTLTTSHPYNVTNITNNLMDVFTLNYLPLSIIYVTPIPSITPISGGMINITFNFTVMDLSGADNLNLNSANASFSKNGISRTNTSCAYIESFNNYYANFSCTIGMYYFDSSGFWNITANIQNKQGETGKNDSTAFNYQELRSWEQIQKEINWSNVMLGDTDKLADQTVTLLDLGNVNITSITINASHLVGESYPTDLIPSEYFATNTLTCALQGWHGMCNSGTSCAGQILTENQNISVASLIPYNESDEYYSAGKKLEFCLKQTGVIRAQSYVSFRDWKIDVSFSLALIVFKRKKKKKIKKNLLELEEKIKKYNTTIEELLEIAKEERVLEKIKQRKTEKDREIIKIPLEIFKGEISPSEVLSKYLKENLDLGFNEIARLINRDQRTIWINYKNSCKKRIDIKIKKNSIKVPISIFSNRKLSILESIVKYLKEKGFRNLEIAEIINKDQRIIGTIHSRIKKKLKGQD